MKSMPFIEAVRLAVDALQAHKLRSFLTLLGVIFGVMVVVAVASLIEGMNVYVASTLEEDFGPNTVILDKYGIITSLDAWIAAQKNKDISTEDYKDLKERAAKAKHIGIRLETNEPYLRYGGDEIRNIQVRGDSPSLLDMGADGIAVTEGRFINDIDEDNRLNVVFIGYKVRDKFFKNINPVGREIRIKGEPFQVIGVSKELGTFLGNERDNFVIIPSSVHLKMYGPRQSLSICMQPKDGFTTEDLQDEVRAIMRSRHHLRFDQKDDFAFFGADAIKDLWNSLTAVIATVAIGITSISLVVGGIVIMNIMMVAVTERTREIGIRKSLGARSTDILRQFLVESSLLSGVGGFIGLAVAWIGMFLASKAFSLPFAMPLWAIVLSLSVSTGVGLIFGIYPAYRAAKLDPITALRQEG